MVINQEKLKVKKYENAYAIVGNQNIVHVYDSNHKFVEFTTKRKVGTDLYNAPSVQPLFSDIEYCDEDVLYIGFLRGHWGHFIVDSSIRMWALQPEIRCGKKILVSIEGLQDLYKRLFEFWNINDSDVIILSDNKQYKSIYVPDISYYANHYITQDFLQPFKYISSKVSMDLPIYENIYLSRLHFCEKNAKKELGERAFQDTFEKNGYKVLYPEELDLKEQIWYYKNCKSIVATVGTIAHNVVWMKPGTELILLRRYPMEKGHQEAIDMVNDINCINLDVYAPKSSKAKSLMILNKEFMDFCNKKKIYVEKKNFMNEIRQRILFYVPLLYKIINKVKRNKNG